MYTSNLYRLKAVLWMHTSSKGPLIQFYHLQMHIRPPGDGFRNASTPTRDARQETLQPFQFFQPES
jgi:hypothetical protein